jgi:hypothetical protein
VRRLRDREEPEVVADGEYRLPLPGRRPEALAFSGVQPHWLLEQHVNAGPKQVRGNSRMPGRRDGHDGEVDLAWQRAVIGDRSGCRGVAAEALGAFQHRIGEHRESDGGGGENGRQVIPFGHCAAADETEAEGGRSRRRPRRRRRGCRLTDAERVRHR